MLNATRRRFLQGAGGLLTYSALAKTLKAQSGQGVAPNPHFFLFLQIHGAWDICLATDPKDREALFPDGKKQFDQPYPISEVKDFANGIRLAPDGALLGRWADRMAIVNGIDMEADNGHINDFSMTGFSSSRDNNLPYVQSVLAKRQPYVRNCSIPHLFSSYDGHFFAGRYVGSTLASTPEDLLSLIGRADKPDSSLAASKAMLQEFRDRRVSDMEKRALAIYQDSIDRTMQIGNKLEKSGFQAPDTTENPESVGNLIGQLFAAGALGSATLSFGTNPIFGSNYSFDTHDNHYASHPLKNFMSDADALFKALAQVKLDEHTSVLERTTVVITAEFCRTPRLNPLAGKDHNIHTNSLILLGHRVRPGVFGASGVRRIDGQLESHAALPIDFKTGRVSETGVIPSIRNIWAGLGAVADVDLKTEFGTDTQPISFLG